MFNDGAGSIKEAVNDEPGHESSEAKLSEFYQSKVTVKGLRISLEDLMNSEGPEVKVYKSLLESQSNVYHNAVEKYNELFISVVHQLRTENKDSEELGTLLNELTFTRLVDLQLMKARILNLANGDTQAFKESLAKIDSEIEKAKQAVLENPKQYARLRNRVGE